MIETGDGYLLQIEMPGVGKEGVEISTEGNELTIVARRSQKWAIDGALIHHESRPENFRRTFELDSSIDVNTINTKVEQGLLTLTLPKAEHVKPRKIAVS